MAGFLVGLVMFIMMVAYATWADAVALVHLWRWFVVPVFELPQLNLAQAMGVSLTVGFLTYQSIFSKGEDDIDKLVRALGLWLIHPWIVLLAGYIIASFM